MSPKQCRAARAWCGIDIVDLAKLAGVHPDTVSRFEKGKSGSHGTVSRLRSALEEHGIRFVFSREGEPIGIEGKP